MAGFVLTAPPQPNEASQYNTVFLNNGDSYNLSAGADFLFCIAAVINIKG